MWGRAVRDRRVGPSGANSWSRSARRVGSASARNTRSTSPTIGNHLVSCQGRRPDLASSASQPSCTAMATTAGSIVRQVRLMTSGRVDGPSGRVLVGVDDPETALFVAHVLANRGRFEVTHTADPATALRLAAAEHWDLLVTDLDMPGMTGLELLGALRRVAPGLPGRLVRSHAPGEMTAAPLRPAAHDLV